MYMRHFSSALLLMAAILCGCSPAVHECSDEIRIVSWGGISADKADTLYSLAKECGFNTHLGLYSTQKNAVRSMDAAARAGMDIIINFPQIKDSTESAVALIKDHPALIAYHIKDEPDTSDFGWLKALKEKIADVDPEHPCYINLLPNWAWDVDEYAEKIALFASTIDVPFYSFDNYPIIEKEGSAVVRPDWYRNLEEFSEMSRRNGKPFWGFALAKAHSITVPWPDTTYPEPTLGHLRLQVFSNLLYGAQAIQYFNFLGLVDPATCRKKPAFDLIKQVNSEVRAYSSVFACCNVLGVWHTGDMIPSHTKRLVDMPHSKLKSLNMSGEGAVVSLLENNCKTFLAVQNRSLTETQILDIVFSGKVRLLTSDKELLYDGKPLEVDPGEAVIFML